MGHNGPLVWLGYGGLFMFFVGIEPWLGYSETNHQPSPSHHHFYTIKHPPVITIFIGGEWVVYIIYISIFRGVMVTISKWVVYGIVLPTVRSTMNWTWGPELSHSGTTTTGRPWSRQLSWGAGGNWFFLWGKPPWLYNMIMLDSRWDTHGSWI
jgi:hypothetical protein